MQGGRVNEDSVRHLISEFEGAVDDVQATQKEKLQACTWIIARIARETPPDMTSGMHLVDVITRVMEDLAKTLRGVLARYGNSNIPRR